VNVSRGVFPHQASVNWMFSRKSVANGTEFETGTLHPYVTVVAWIFTSPSLSLGTGFFYLFAEEHPAVRLH
jgi:hypothetical protein